jgi:hypothetical protein
MYSMRHDKLERLRGFAVLVLLLAIRDPAMLCAIGAVLQRRPEVIAFT